MAGTATATGNAHGRVLAGQAAIVAVATLLLGGFAAALPVENAAPAAADGITLTSFSSAFALAPGESVTWPVRVNAPANGWTSLRMRLSILNGDEDPFARSATVQVRQCEAATSVSDAGSFKPEALRQCRAQPFVVVETVVLQDIPPAPVSLGASADSILLLVDVELPAGAAVLGSSAELRVDLVASDSRDSIVGPPDVPSDAAAPDSGLARTGLQVLPMALLGLTAVITGIGLARLLGRPREQRS